MQDKFPKKRLIRKNKIVRPDLPSAQVFFDGIKNGDRVLLSRAITLVESSHPKHRILAESIIELCLPISGGSLRIGITGIPGVGKSTFIESFGTYITKDLGQQLAVLAIDPSSDKSKGSILGDKTRMEALSADPKAFIRPSPAKGSLGGVARSTRETIILCEAAGFKTILVETVGVGQSEIAVNSMVDFFLLLMLAGAGDELQGIKRGIMEMADSVAITKADGDNVNNARKARIEYKNALGLFPHSDTGWIPKVECISAIKNEGMESLWAIISEHESLMKETGKFEEKRKIQAHYWMHGTIKEQLMTRFYESPQILNLLNKLEEKVHKGIISPFKAADELLNEFKNSRL